MPHDSNGRKIEKGDRVTVEFVVTEVHQLEDFCNVSLIVPGEHGASNVVSSLTVNSRQTTILSHAPASPLLDPPPPAPRRVNPDAPPGDYC